MPFVKGQSGNPAGRPPGARNRKTLIAEAVFEAHAEQIAAHAVERALMGDNAALRLCIGVLLPRATERPVPFPLPAITGAKDVEQAAVSIAAAVGTGELTPREALELLRVVDRSVKIIEAARAAQQAAGDEVAADEPEHAAATTTQTNDQSDAPAATTPASDQPVKTTMKYNEPPRTAEGAGEPAKPQPETTTKYNTGRQDRLGDDIRRAA
jgi:Family of unknown function (DUF5681)